MGEACLQQQGGVLLVRGVGRALVVRGAERLEVDRSPKEEEVDEPEDEEDKGQAGEKLWRASPGARLGSVLLVWSRSVVAVAVTGQRYQPGLRTMPAPWTAGGRRPSFPVLAHEGWVPGSWGWAGGSPGLGPESLSPACSALQFLLLGRSRPHGPA